MLQAPPEQDAVPWVLEHTLPQAPQLLTSAANGFSHPSESVPLQLPYRKVHELIAQLPVEQVAVALVRLQVVPQVPQLVVVFREVSQPLLALLSQLP